MRTITDNEIEAVKSIKCPLCNADPGSPCVYMRPEYLPEHSWSSAAQARRERIGTPTRLPHAKRVGALLTRRDHRAMVARRKALVAQGIASTPPAVFSLRAFDLAEYQRLREWLTRYAPILWTQGEKR
jgi:hypothetical protein